MKAKDGANFSGKSAEPESLIFLSELRKKLRDILPAPRFQHSQGVSYTGAALAMCHGADLEKARLAGLLHDCGKAYRNDELPRLCEEAGIKLSPEELQVPHVWHAIYAPHMAKKMFQIQDEEVLSALRWHTTGKAHMSLLEKIVYLADYIEPGRYKSPNLPRIRELAFSDLDRAILNTVEDTLNYLKRKKLNIDTSTMSCYLWLKEKYDGK